LDGITSFLPNPTQVENIALDLRENEKPVVLSPDSNEPFIGLAFKLEEGRYGQLTYIRVYQGQITRGDMIFNTKNGKKVKVPRLVRMHSNEMEDVNELKSGEIGAMFGVECASGDTFTDGKLEFSMVKKKKKGVFISNNTWLCQDVHVCSRPCHLSGDPAQEQG